MDVTSHQKKRLIQKKIFNNVKYLFADIKIGYLKLVLKKVMIL